MGSGSWWWRHGGCHRGCRVHPHGGERENPRLVAEADRLEAVDFHAKRLRGGSRLRSKVFQGGDGGVTAGLFRVIGGDLPAEVADCQASCL
jgi:hypothetical protein